MTTDEPAGDGSDPSPTPLPAPPVPPTGKPARPRVTPARAPKATPKPPDDPPEQGRSGAAVGGGGLGTLFVFWVTNLPADDWRKPYLMLATPSLTLVAVYAGRWIVQGGRAALRYLRLRFSIWGVRRALHKALGNPLTSETHKAALQKELEELEVYDIETQKAALKAQTPPAPGK